MPRSVPDAVPLRHRLTVRLTAWVTLVLLLIGTPFLLAFHRLVRGQEMAVLAESATRTSRFLVEGLRAAMLSGHPKLLDGAVLQVADRPDVRRVTLLDHEGHVRISSDPQWAGRAFEKGRDETCRACHDSEGTPPPGRTVVFEEGSSRFFRTVTAIHNQPVCHECHDAQAAVNGILLVDLPLTATDERFFAGIGSTLALAAVMVVVTIAGLVLLLNRLVHAPLRAVIDSSRRVAGGELDARTEVETSGEFAVLASHVNRMTDHLARSLQTVETQHRDLQEILDAVDDEIVVLDRERRIVAANAAFRARSGEPGEALEGRPCREASTPEWPCGEASEEDCPVRRVFGSDRLHKGIVTERRPAGDERTIEIHASPIRDADGVVTHAVEVRRDISERRQLEASVAHSEHLAALGLLASGLSHEINNPLGAIATSVEGLRRRVVEEGPGADGTPSLVETLGRIEGEIERCRGITHRLLRVARPSTSARGVVDVNQVVHDIVAIQSHHADRSGIVTELLLGERIPCYVGDASRLAQVLMNVTMNAIQAMEHGGKLRIVTEAAEGTVRIEIRDTGPGIPADLQKRIFEPFFTTKPVGKGTGLGLFITHRIVTDLGGRVTVRSRV